MSDQIQGQGHEPFKVTAIYSAIYSVSGSWQLTTDS